MPCPWENPVDHNYHDLFKVDLLRKPDRLGPEKQMAFILLIYFCTE